MRRFLKILAIVAIIVGALVAILLYSTSGDRDIARNFLLNASSGQYEASMADFHPELAAELPLERLREAFGNAQEYTDVSFSSVQTALGGATSLSGKATTAEGCSSLLNFTILDGKIVSFNIEPLCRKR